MRVCTIDGCDKLVRARGWCSKHYQRWQRHGDPSVYVGRNQGLRSDAARHGSRRKYDLGCRCFPCRAAENRYQQAWRNGARARIDAAVVREHVARLVESGWTKRRIEREAGISNSTLWEVERRPTVNRRTARAILALTPDERPVWSWSRGAA
jgi:lambda repressor-like predicted transcriptional regulator